MLSFAGKTILITGAAGGIGRATARLLASLDANIALTDTSTDALRQAADELASGAGRITTHQLDVTDLASCREVAGAVAGEHGGVDHLVHAAGIYPQVMVEDMTAEQWRTVMSVNVDGTFNICLAVIPVLNDGSSIVNIASVAAHRGSYSHAHYSASKGAVVSFTRSLARELAPRTRVNAISPGLIETAMTVETIKQIGPSLLEGTPLKRFGTADEVAGGIVFLCSSLASFVTGESLQVNGGLHMS